MKQKLNSSHLLHMIRIAIVEDNTTLRQSLEQMFNRVEGFQCVASLSNLMNVVSDLSHATPNIVLMDIGLPNITGIEGVRTVKSNFPEVQVLMFTVFEDEDKIFDAIRAGASGYLLKKTPPEEIIDAIRQLYEGGAPMSPSIARKVIKAFQSQPSNTINDYQLTAREKEILYSLVDGLSYKKIAEKYFVSISTIRTHISNIYQKLHVNSKSQAVAKVLQNR
jgi:DNA-binding NarL/FixJ family response regulator